MARAIDQPAKQSYGQVQFYTNGTYYRFTEPSLIFGDPKKKLSCSPGFECQFHADSLDPKQIESNREWTGDWNPNISPGEIRFESSPNLNDHWNPTIYRRIKRLNVNRFIDRAEQSLVNSRNPVFSWDTNFRSVGFRFKIVDVNSDHNRRVPILENGGLMACI